MRAKSVNEVQNFERGQNPKAAIGIGGINLKNKFEDALEDLEMDIDMTKLSKDEEWEEFLRKTLIGKTITADLRPLPGFDIKTKKSIQRKQPGKYTIKVQDIKLSQKLSKSLEKVFTGTHSIIVADIENTMYTLDLQKIYIEDEG